MYLQFCGHLFDVDSWCGGFSPKFCIFGQKFSNKKLGVTHDPDVFDPTLNRTCWPAGMLSSGGQHGLEAIVASTPSYKVSLLASLLWASFLASALSCCGLFLKHLSLVTLITHNSPQLTLAVIHLISFRSHTVVGLILGLTIFPASSSFLASHFPASATPYSGLINIPADLWTNQPTKPDPTQITDPVTWFQFRSREACWPSGYERPAVLGVATFLLWVQILPRTCELFLVVTN